MKTKKFLFYLLAVLLGGCIPVKSIQPLYTKENVVFEKKLVGTWVDDPNSPNTTWEFKRVVVDSNNESKFELFGEPEKAYELIFSDNEGKRGSFFAHLVKLENRLFLDVYPSQWPHMPQDPNKVEWLYNHLFFMPVHTFIKVDSIKPQLKMRLTNESEMKKLFEEDPNALKHTLVEESLILTASTKELQAFVLKYANDSRVFTDETILSRKKNQRPQRP